ncbi:MAG: hypothetical protein LBI18_08425 [Planctomycetaceae bacterium]|jgi:hypothetical protein|nr:hypothetical protein [Planctomycetaceae bacterium]
MEHRSHSVVVDHKEQLNHKEKDGIGRNIAHQIDVGDSRLAPVFGWQFGLESDCQLNTGSELPCGNATVGESPSAKGCRLV